MTAAAMQAYASVEPLLPFQDLSYEAARAHTSGDSLAEYLVIELTEGAAGKSDAARFQRAADQVEHAIGSLRHVRDRLRERASACACLPLPFAPPGPAEAATQPPPAAPAAG